MVDEVRDAGGHFLPGSSGNPGGRPTRDLVVRRLADRRGGEAVRLLVELLGGEGAVIVIDARQVLTDLVERLGRGRDVAGVDDVEAYERPAIDPEDHARRLAGTAAGLAFDEGWLKLQDPAAVDPVSGARVFGKIWYVSKANGERLSFWHWQNRRARVVDLAEAEWTPGGDDPAAAG